MNRFIARGEGSLGRTVRRSARAWMLGFGLALGALAAQAQVTVTDLNVPNNIGNQLTGTVDVDYVRTSSVAATITVPLPSLLEVNPPALPAGCVFNAPNVQCAVPPGGPGATGRISFDVRGTAVGAYNLLATGTGDPVGASQPGTVAASGDLRVAKTRTAPAGTPVTGQAITFRLAATATGGDTIPAGSAVTIVDTLPGVASDFAVSNITVTPSGAATCTGPNALRQVICTLNGPLTPAQLAALTIDITGSSSNSGNFINNASVATNTNVGSPYFDRDPNNNTANVPYTVNPGTDFVPTGSSFPTTSLTDTTQSLVLTFRNDGPTNAPAGGIVRATIPAGFTIGALPTGCALGPGAGDISCTAGAIASGAAQNFTILLGTPAAAASGNIPVTVIGPAGITDANAGNNTINLPYAIVPPTGDLRITKSKTGGPLPEGAAIVNTINVTNVDISTVTYTAGTGATPLRVVDTMPNQEEFVSAGAGWTCVDGGANSAGAGQRRVTCVVTVAGTLAPGAGIPLTLNTRVATPLAAPVSLNNTACTGKQALNILGLTDANGSQPRDPNTANDCAGAGVVGTPVIGGEARVDVIKESSVDGVNWFDPPASGPTVLATSEFAYWRIRIATPNTAQNATQSTIPSLDLTDNLPGILNLAAAGPTPAHVTPPVTATTTVTGAGASGSCPNLPAGNGNLTCNFTSVQPGTTITVVLQVKRPFDAGLLGNRATVTSGNAILSGATSDDAALTVEPRVDPAVTGKTINPPDSATEPRVGQTVTFTITSRNHGVNAIPSGNYTISDTFDITKYALISAAGTNLNCSIAGGLVTCVNTNAVARADVRSVAIVARIIKPAALGPTPVFAGEVNTASVILGGGLCEFKEETTSNPQVSATCNDSASTSNNRAAVTFDVKLPLIDLQQRKSRIAPPGGAYAFGDTLKYSMRTQNRGPSRAEQVVVADYLTVPAGFTFAGVTATAVNGTAAEPGFTLDTTKTGSVSCVTSGTTAIACRLDANAANSFLDPGREVNFTVEVTYTGNSQSPATFGNQAVVCAAETALYESIGACSTLTTAGPTGANNNTASAQDVVFPKVDLSIVKLTLTPQPVSVNQTVQWRLTVRNDGPAPIRQIRVADQLPADFEYVSSAIALGPFVTASPSTTTAANLACVPTPTSITATGQQQSLACLIDAVGGPFPGSTDAGNTLSIVVTAKAKAPFFTGPYATNLANNATVTVGIDANGDPLAVDSNPANNAASANVQLQRTSIGGRVYADTNLNRAPDDAIVGQPNVLITLSGTDAFGNPLTVTTTTAANGSYTFDVPPGSYTITKGVDPAGLIDFSSNVPGTIPFGTNGGPVSAGTPATTAAGSPSATNVISGVQLAAGNNANGYNFAEISGGTSLSGRVFLDNNDDGLINGPDVGIPGVTVTLSGLDVNGNPVNRTTATDAIGNYSFLGLFPGIYSVTQPNQPTTANGATLPAGVASTASGKTAPGTGATAQGTATTPNITPSVISGIRLDNGQASVANNFGEILPSAISGRVFFDANNNGTFNAPGDTPLAGVSLTLTGTDDLGFPVSRSTTTSASGTYSFGDLRPGTYTVTEPSQPPNTGNGITTAGPVPNGGTAGTATPVSATPSRIANIVLPRNTISPNNDFAEIAAPLPTGASISGKVWLDANNNGVIDAGEPGIGGVTITLTGTDTVGNLVNLSQVTGPDGSYSFQNLLPGAYRITQPNQPSTANGATLPPGITQTSNGETRTGVGGIQQGPGTAPSTTPSSIGTIIVGAGNNSVDNNFGELAPSTISGRVYFDANTNGARDATDPPIAGVRIVLTGTDGQGRPVTRETVTDANGAYEFTGLQPGSYTVTEPTQPPGTDNAETNAGTINNGGAVGTATPRATVPSAIANIRIVVGGTVSPENNFGEGGGSPDVVVTKLAREEFFTENNTGTYDLSVRNAGVLPTNGEYVVYDKLPRTSPPVWRIESASGAGWSCAIDADRLGIVCRSSTVLPAGALNPAKIEVKIAVAEGAKAQSPLRNFTLVRGGGESAANDPFPGKPIDPNASGAPSDAELRGLVAGSAACVDAPAQANQNYCVRATPVRFSVAIGGRVWLDGTGQRNTYDPGDRNFPGWRILVVDPALYDPAGKGIPPGAIVRTGVTGPDGTYRVNNLISGKPYYVFFQDPDGRTVFAGPVNGDTRNPQTCSKSPTGGDTTSRSLFLDIAAPEGRFSNDLTCAEQSLPIDPQGVVYDSQSRAPIPGAIVTLKPEGICTGYDPAIHVVGYNQYSSFDAQGNPQMTTGADGFYKFLLAANAPASCRFRIEVTAPPGFVAPSSIILPAAALQTPVGAGLPYRVQPQPTPPTGSQSTIYHYVFLSGSSHNDVLNNHIPLDPLDPGQLRISKTGSVRVVELGDTMEYTIAVAKWNGSPLNTVIASDTLPAGFRYLPGTFRIAGTVQPDPSGSFGPVLNFPLPNLVAGATVSFTYRVRVGIGAQEGDGINRVRATGRVGPITVTSNTAEYRVRVEGGVFTNEACVVGKAYVDCNGNQVQDAEELGIPGVKLYFDDGTFMVSDSEGKYSICGRQPRTYVLKADPATLPRGSRLVTSSSRNVGDAGSLFVDLKNGMLQRADFIEGSCSNTVLEQVKARRTRGEVSAPETERKDGPALIFRSKSSAAPAQATDSANQPFLQPRDRGGSPPPGSLETERSIPVPDLPVPVAPRIAPEPGAAIAPRPVNPASATK